MANIMICKMRKRVIDFRQKFFTFFRNFRQITKNIIRNISFFFSSLKIFVSSKVSAIDIIILKKLVQNKLYKKFLCVMLFFFIYYLKATKYTVSQRNRFIPIIKIAYIMTITAPLPPPYLQCFLSAAI